jgi:regulatory protein
MAFPRSKKFHDEESLYDYAVRALGRRMRTVAELKRLLRQKRIAGEAEAIIDKVIARLKDQRYLNDSQYAANYAALRRDGSKHGRQRVITDLKVKGVHGDVIAKQVSEAYDGVDEEQQAREYLRKKRIKQPSQAKRSDALAMKKSQRETARVFRTLVRAGFRTGTVISILKKWDVEDETLLELESETEGRDL